MISSLGTEVLVQDMASKRWNIPATVKEGRVSEDGSIRSFIVERENGVELLRNSRYLKHEWKNPRGKKPKNKLPLRALTWHQLTRPPLTQTEHLLSKHPEWLQSGFFL